MLSDTTFPNQWVPCVQEQIIPLCIKKYNMNLNELEKVTFNLKS